MSTAPTPGPRDAKEPRQHPLPAAKPTLIFDDPLDRQSSDDMDGGWGERPPTSGDSAADLARFLDEKPPHHL